jgi:hypothetical protein
MSDNVDPKDKRESGQPGGGAGRRDEVGGSGVYPMSGPHPKGPATVRTEAAWGQGERGAAGYEDHGGSELSWDGREVLGGLNVGPGGEPLSATDVSVQEIDRYEWIAFLDRFSREHHGWRVDVEVVSEGSKHTEAVNVPLEGVNADRLNDPDGRVYVETGESADEHLTHSISQPRRVCWLKTRSGQHLGLDIEAVDGTRTFVRFRAPIAPEMLDHVA